MRRLPCLTGQLLAVVSMAAVAQAPNRNEAPTSPDPDEIAADDFVNELREAHRAREENDSPPAESPRETNASPPGSTIADLLALIRGEGTAAESARGLDEPQEESPEPQSVSEE